MQIERLAFGSLDVLDPVLLIEHQGLLKLLSLHIDAVEVNVSLTFEVA